MRNIIMIEWTNLVTYYRLNHAEFKDIWLYFEEEIIKLQNYRGLESNNEKGQM